MTSDSKRDDHSGTQPAPQPTPTTDPKKPVTPDSKPWQEPAGPEAESGEST